jgi:putative spermidine/putrescine transport system permease protein
MMGAFASSLPRWTRGYPVKIAAYVAFLVVLAPLLAVIWVSFFENKIIGFPPTGYTLKWFANVWNLERFHRGFILSVEVGLIATSVSILIGVPAALALARKKFVGREVVHSLLMSPLIVPGIVAGAAIFMFFIEVEVLLNDRFKMELPLAGSLFGLCVGHSLLALPWTVRLVTASLIGMDRQVEEAAMTLGATPWWTFWHITLPIIRPGIVAGAVFSFVTSFVDLEKSIFLVGPGRTTLPIEMINYLEWNIDPTIAAVATIQALIIAAALIVSDYFFRITRAF